MRFLLTILALGALGAGGYYGYANYNKPPAAPTYLTAKVERGTLTQTVLATGILEPLVKVLVGSRVSGNVTAWYKDFNATVKAGDLLAELDQDRITAVIAQRRADLAVANARVEEAAARVAETELQLRRLEAAFARAASSDFEVQSARIAVDAAKAALHAAEAQVKSAQSSLDTAEIDLLYTKVYAPIDGVVISRDIDTGQTVAASLQAPTLFTIAQDLRKMRVSAAVSENDIGNVREGMPAEFKVDAYPTQKFKGVVTQVRYKETVANNVVTYQTLIDVENPDLLLRPGMTASITFEVKKVDDILMVPNAALRFDPNAASAAELNWSPGRGARKQPRVFRLVDGELKEFAVTLGITDGVNTQIESKELPPGTEIVTERILTTAAPPTAGRSPFGSQGGGGGRGRRFM
ncbi:MAG: efflux RND transporter periplasmic adaptor subunit [Phycisphaerae bacterium]|nr:efflux RND transporter periplasmic adaptor subunit [Phycisphaerae bacterium]